MFPDAWLEAVATLIGGILAIVGSLIGGRAGRGRSVTPEELWALGGAIGRLPGDLYFRRWLA